MMPFSSPRIRRTEGALILSPVRAAIATIADQVDAVGHRVVHGGSKYTSAVVIDAAVERELDRLTDLAPLHQPKSLAGIDAVRGLLSDVPAVACFDTAFHATMAAEASTYAVPAEWRERYGVRRYGFHGLSHAYASRRGAELIGRSIEELRIVTCHLGAGASLAAVRQGLLGRYDDGLHASGRPCHGDPLGNHRPRSCALAPPTLSHDRRRGRRRP